MSFWKRIFGGIKKALPTVPVASHHSFPPSKEASALPTPPRSESTSQTYKECDNVGTRYETADEVKAYSLARDLPGSGFSVETIGSPRVLTFPEGPQSRKIPFIYYYFYVGSRDGKADAIAAMTELPCFKIATDSGKLISTEVLEFGLYPNLASKGSGEVASWSVFVGGTHLSLELYKAAIDSFKKHHGNEKRVSSPPAPAKTSQTTAGTVPTSVTFVREEHPGPNVTKRIYNAPSEACALAFLQTNPIDKPLYYIEVDTPAGRFGRDIDGIYG